MQDESYFVCITPSRPGYCPIQHPPRRLDVAGIAVLSHDFGALDGKDSDVTHVLNAFGAFASVSHNLIMLAQAFPSILKLPLPRTQFARRLNQIIGKICQEMVVRMRKEKETGGAEEGDRSCLGSLREFCLCFLT